MKKTRLFYNQCLGRDKITISESKKELDAIFSSIKFKLRNVLFFVKDNFGFWKGWWIGLINWYFINLQIYTFHCLHPTKPNLFNYVRFAIAFEYFTLYICVDFDLRNLKTKREFKENRVLQNCLSQFLKPDFRYWVSLRCFVLSFGLRAQRE